MAAAVPSGYTVALTINTLGVLTNALGVNTTLYQCPTCRATTLDPVSHDAWHAANTAAIKAASDAAAAAQTAATNASSAASAASTAAGTANTAAGKAMTAANAAGNAASDSMTAAQAAAGVAQAALPAADVTLCPLCRVAVNTGLLTTHLTYHYRRAHGDPIEFPMDFDPDTSDLKATAPPSTVNGG